MRVTPTRDWISWNIGFLWTFLWNGWLSPPCFGSSGLSENRNMQIQTRGFVARCYWLLLVDHIRSSGNCNWLRWIQRLLWICVTFFKWPISIVTWCRSGCDIKNNNSWIIQTSYLVYRCYWIRREDYILEADSIIFEYVCGAIWLWWKDIGSGNIQMPGDDWISQYIINCHSWPGLPLLWVCSFGRFLEQRWRFPEHTTGYDEIELYLSCVHFSIYCYGASWLSYNLNSLEIQTRDFVPQHRFRIRFMKKIRDDGIISVDRRSLDKSKYWQQSPVTLFLVVIGFLWWILRVRQHR